MKNIVVSTLSLTYNPIEDRMLLVLNKDGKERIDFLITRRFYLTLLFELETFLENRDMPLSLDPQNTQPNTSNNHSTEDVHPKQRITSSLLETVDINFINASNSFLLTFKSKQIEAQSHFEKQKFIYFYTMLKNKFPKNEWGMMA